jgi:hypothetical protein
MISVEKVERSLAFPVIDMRDLGDATEEDSHDNPYQEARTLWLADPAFCSLKRLGHELGVDRIVLAQRATLHDSEPLGPASQGFTTRDIQGSYYFNLPLSKLQFDDWILPTRQKSTLRKLVLSGGAVIIVNVFTDDACEILSHEIGHHVVHFIANLKIPWQWATPTNMGRLDSRFDPYCLEINDEFFAESFRFYLTGEPMGRIDLRGILDRVRKNDSRAFNLLRNYRKRAVRAAYINARSLKLNRNTSLAA